LSTSSIEPPIVSSLGDPLAARVRTRLNISFAIATCLSGMTLAGNPSTEILPVIACLFAIVGLIFVDLLRWFALPPLAAYLALGAIAFYSISRLLEIGAGTADEQQMVVVAELLVFVQAVLMLQRKNRRIYEQLAIFCLLELIVASIFNDAVSYGILLLPLGIVGAAALALLQTYATTQDVFNQPLYPKNFQDRSYSWDDDIDSEHEARARSFDATAVIRIGTIESANSFRKAGLYLPRVTLMVFAPAVLMVAMLFFYGLPRTSMSASSGGGKVLVGFSDSVRLGQIGQMLQSDAPALRVELLDRSLGKPYSTISNLYLRGAVLEHYHSGMINDGNWSTIDARAISITGLLPEQEQTRGGWNANDVRVRITVEPNNTASLFSLPPYHRLATIPEVRHQSDRWLLSRRDSIGLLKTSRITYQFGSTAFRDARQTRYVPRWDDQVIPETEILGDDRDLDNRSSITFPGRRTPPRQITRYDADQYIRRCLEYDEYRIPSAWQLSEPLAEMAGPNPLMVASAIERFLTNHGGYRYSLNHSRTEGPGLDPIEHFLSVSRQGNCQYFASAMALMLRSQGIPSRLVVGYSTDEYNSTGGFYVARQLHAHAWVEALVETKWIAEEDRFFIEGETPQGEIDESGEHWVRFDPTPGGGGVERPSGGRVSEVLEIAQNIWTDYVVDRNTSIRNRGEFTRSDDDAVVSQYQSMFRWIDTKLELIRAGELGGGAIAIGRHFSWPAALLGVGMTLLAAAMFSFRWPRRWLGFGRRQVAPQAVPDPSVAFFAEAVRLLRRIGIERSLSQTPLELTDRATEKLVQSGDPSLDRPLRLLTDAFYDTRFSGNPAWDPTEETEVPPQVAAALQSVRERVELIESRSASLPFKP